MERKSIANIQVEIGNRTRRVLSVLKGLMENYCVRMKYLLVTPHNAMYQNSYLSLKRKGGDWNVYWGEEDTLLTGAPFEIKVLFLRNAKKIIEAYQKRCFEVLSDAEQCIQSMNAFTAHAELFDERLEDPLKIRVVSGKELFSRLSEIRGIIRVIEAGHPGREREADNFSALTLQVENMEKALGIFLGEKTGD